MKLHKLLVFMMVFSLAVFAKSVFAQDDDDDATEEPEEMDEDMWQAQMDEFTAKKADLTTQLATLTTDIDGLKKRLDDLGIAENNAKNSLYNMVGSYEGYQAYKTKFADAEKRVNACKGPDDAAAIENATARLNIINRLQKKHGVITMDDLLKTQSEIKEKLNKFGDLSSDIENLELDIHQKEITLKSLADKLGEARRKVIPSLEKDVHNLLSGLGMNHAQIKVHMGTLPSFSNSGLDDISILFAPNKGSDFLPLKDTASGGEMSRLTLIIKSLVAGALTLPTLIFDEIDAGVSGDIAGKMGEILNNLAKKHQIIAITHSPQIAAKAMSHYWVYKNDTESRTVTAMRQLDQGERVHEIAKMLSGNPPTEAAKANARELIGL